MITISDQTTRAGSYSKATMQALGYVIRSPACGQKTNSSGPTNLSAVDGK